MASSDQQPIAGPNPYVGPRPFEDGETLYGRENEINELYYLLSAERIVLLHSPSGAGKSSLVQAGLIPQLRQRFDVWRPTRVNLEPSHVANNVNRYVLSALQGFEEGIPESLQRSAEILSQQTLADYVETRPKRRGAPQRVVVIFDQFEEILTVDPLAIEAKQAFFDQLGQLLNKPWVWTLFVLREDYLAPLDPYAEQVPTHLRNRFRIDLLSLEATREVLVEPARQGGRDFPAADQLIRDLSMIRVQQADGSFQAQPGQHVEPVQLQVVCRRLWDAMPAYDLSIDEDDLAEFGDVDEALAKYYADTTQVISDGVLSTERAIRKWFNSQLITADGIRNQVLRGAEESEELANYLIEQLRDKHLVRAENRSGATWYELSHDRLVQPVRDNNSVWHDIHLSDLQRQAELWNEQKNPEGLLFQDQTLSEAEHWAETHVEELTFIEQEFLDKCREKRAADERERRRTRLIRQLAVGASIIAVVAVIASILAYRQQQEAIQQKRLAEQQTQVAEQQKQRATEQKQEAERQRNEALRTQSLLLADQSLKQSAEYDFTTAMLLALEALPRDMEQPDRPYVASTQLALVTAVTQNTEKRLFQIHSDEITGLQLSSDDRYLLTAAADNTAKLFDLNSSAIKSFKHDDWVTQAVFGSTKRYILTTSEDSITRIWDIRNGAVIQQFEHEDVVVQAEFSADERYVITASEDGSARLWDARTGKKIHTFEYEESVTQAKFSADDRYVLTTSGDGKAQLWDTRSGTEFRTFSHDNWVSQAVFSTDGDFVFTACDDGAARQWSVASGREVQVFSDAVEVPVKQIMLSADTHYLFTASNNEFADALNPGIVRRWSVQSGEKIKTYLHPKQIKQITLSADSRYLLTVADDGIARLWSVENDDKPLQVFKHEAEINRALFHPETQQVLTGSKDGSIRQWQIKIDGDALATWQFEHGKSVRQVALSTDGRYVLSASKDDTAKLWAEGRNIKTFAHQAALTQARFSADNRSVLTASEDGIVKLSVIEGTADVQVFPHDTAVHQALLSADSRYLLTASKGGSVWAWKPSDGTLIKAFHPQRKAEKSETVQRSLWSPDAVHVFTTVKGGTLQLWQIEDEQRVQQFSHNGAIYQAMFNAEGSSVLTASEGGATLWDVQSGELIKNFNPEPIFQSSMVNQAQFSDNERYVLTTSASGSLLWDIQSGEVVQKFLQEGWTQQAGFLANDSYVFAATRKGAMRLWQSFPTTQNLIDYACQILPRRLASQQREAFFLPEGQSSTIICKKWK